MIFTRWISTGLLLGELPGVEVLEHQDLLQDVEHLVLRLVPMKPSMIVGVLELFHLVPALQLQFPRVVVGLDLQLPLPLWTAAAYGDAKQPPWEPTSPTMDVVFAPNNHTLGS